MNANLSRNALTLLFILTAANIAASLGALSAAHAIRNESARKLAESSEKLDQVNQTVTYIGASVAQLCAANAGVCPPAPQR